MWDIPNSDVICLCIWNRLTLFVLDFPEKQSHANILRDWLKPPRRPGKAPRAQGTVFVRLSWLCCPGWHAAQLGGEAGRVHDAVARLARVVGRRTCGSVPTELALAI